jgi:hypothetical protein
VSGKYVIEERVIERAMASYPEIEEIVAFSTPVVSFGNPRGAKVATLGINPSSNEFQIGNGNKSPLGEFERKRLIDTEILELSNPKNLTREQAIKVIEGCYDYFTGPSANPYGWFQKLEKFVLKPAGYTYYGPNASACHLDLVQWATDPVWDSILDKSIKVELLKLDKEFLRYQLTSYHFDFVFLNGGTVVKQFKKLDIAKLEVVHQVTRNSKGDIHKVFKGTSNGTTYYGWGINAASGDANKKGLEELSNWINTQY